jgi:hypothetical protein
MFDIPASRRKTPLAASLLAVVLLVLLSGCSTVGQERSGSFPTSVASEPADDATSGEAYQPWFHSARALVAAELDVNLSHISLRIVDTPTIQGHARNGLLRAMRHDIDNDVFAKALVRNILTAQSSGSVLAIYSPEAKAILLHRENFLDYLNAVANLTSEQQAVQALLFHELIHAADDVKHKVFEQRNASYQEVFSKSTILEGHAQWQARRLCQLADCKAGFEQLNNYMFSRNNVDDPALSYIQTRNFRNLQFVYREGERFVDHLMRKSNGELLLEQAFNNPPRDSLQIIDPASFPNRGRENRNLQISNLIKASRKPWRDNEKSLLTRNIVAAAAFAGQPEARDPIVEFYTERVIAAAKHEYYDQKDEVPIPIAITVMQTDNDTTAVDTASLIFESTAGTYRNLDGQLVQLSHWHNDIHSASIVDNLLGKVDITMHTAGGHMINHMIQAGYPFTVVTASSSDFIVHIDGRFDDQHGLMQYAGHLLIALQRKALQQR